MQTEIDERIEEAASEYIKTCKDNMHSVSEAYCKADFKAGAKFILELPELREAVEALEFYANRMNWIMDEYRGLSGEMSRFVIIKGDVEDINGVRARKAISKLRALGIVKEGE